MRRLLWLGIGLAVGGLVFRAVTKKAQAFTPQGLAGSVQQSAVGMIESVRTFVDDVREAMVERELEIRSAFDDHLTLDEDLRPEEGIDYR
jgi:hypothetical protein